MYWKNHILIWVIFATWCNEKSKNEWNGCNLRFHFQSLCFAADLVCGIKCHYCEKPGTNDACNGQIASCSRGEHDACYTTVFKMEDGTKLYKKVRNKSICIKDTWYDCYDWKIDHHSTFCFIFSQPDRLSKIWTFCLIIFITRPSFKNLNVVILTKWP